MKKPIYIVLILIVLGLLVHTGYYTFTTFSSTQTQQSVAVVATTTQETVNTDTSKKFTTMTGKTVTVTETNPAGQSLSTLTLTTQGFATSSKLVLEKNKLTNILFQDINNDSFEELIILTQAQGSGSYGEATLYTTASTAELLPIKVQDITEADTNQGGLFEGYMGHDVFTIENNTFQREFPIYTKSDTNDTPTGGKRTILYTINQVGGQYTVNFSKKNEVATTSTSVATTTELTPDRISNTSWTLLSSTASGTKDIIATRSKFVLSFDASKNFTSTTDCNSVGGAYTINKSSLTFGPFVTTRMFCENAKEAIYTDLLSKTATYSVVNNNLTLTLSNKATLTFKNNK
jgi:heat shock protein HslJ